MRLYLDDDVAAPFLTRLLRNAAHDVQIPADAGMAGKEDAVHLTHAIREGRVCLSRNYGDFENLHNLIKQAQGHHPGILVVRRDNNPKHNLFPRDVVRAIAKLLASGLPLADQYHILNPWK